MAVKDDEFTFIVDGFDVGKYVEKENYSVSKEWVPAFTHKALNGNDFTTYCGYRYLISVSFKNASSEVIRVMTALSSGGEHNITFTNLPGEATSAAIELAESVSGEISRKLGGGLRWNASFSLKSKLILQTYHSGGPYGASKT